MYENENYSGYHSYEANDNNGNDNTAYKNSSANLNSSADLNSSIGMNNNAQVNSNSQSYRDADANNGYVDYLTGKCESSRTNTNSYHSYQNNNDRGYYSGASYQDMNAQRTAGNTNGAYTDVNFREAGAGSGVLEKSKEKRSAGFFKKAMLSVGLGLFFGLFAGIGFYAVYQVSGMAKAMENAEMVATTDVMANANGETVKLNNTNNITVVESNVVTVAEKVMPAMVSIVNNYTITGSTFWGQTYSEQQASSGSGIIVSESDSELLIVSNNHVVESAEKLEVTFIDGTTAQAYIKGLDSDMDLAVIAVPLDTVSEETMKAITVATLGNSDDLKLGEPVIAIGNALGYGQSVTDGIVSALNREITMDDGSVGTFIQTDAAINPGNSGGALLNVNGEVIGINTSKIGGSTIEGMGYAIPITSANPIIADLMERQTRNKVDEEDMGYIGISLQEVTAQISAMYGMPQGIYVLSVEEGSAAQKAGIMTGDIITKFDGDKITAYSELQNVLQYFAAGDSTTITVMRPENGQYVQYDLEITLGKRPVEKSN